MPQFDDDMAEIFEGFLVETQELLDNISQDLMDIDQSPEDLDLINQIFRSFHTIKGTAAFMGFDKITTITHEAEDILNKMRRSELAYASEITDVLFEVHDWIKLLVEKITEDDDSPVDYSETLNSLKKLKGVVPNQKSNPQAPAPNNTEKETTPQLGNALDNVLDNADIIAGDEDFSEEELEMIQAAFSHQNAGQVQDEINSETASNQEALTEDNENKENKNIANENENTAISKSDEKEDNIPKENTKPIKKLNPNTQNNTQSKTQTKTKSETIRIDVNRLELLMNLSGELVLGRNRLTQITKQIEKGGNLNGNLKEDLQNLVETSSQVDFITSEIQSAVMKMRMVQVAKLYQKAPRIVRDLSKSSKKKINLIVKGEETEIDRGIIEELNDPLVHMIRNSCDHGIESPEERIKLGKEETGQITLDAEQQGNNIILKISDDGKGMNPELLKSKAIEKGVISQEQAKTMSKREALQLIFAPGFSMAKKVTNVSGRGVGMDVVRTNIEKLKGSIEIESELGKGSTFVIKLPLTLAIIQGLVIKIENETYAIPLSSVEEVVSIDTNNISTVNQQQVIRIREEIYPLIFLTEVLGVENANNDLADKNLVIVGFGINKVGLVVNELLGQQEIVIKSLGKYLGSIARIAGSTILGDGKVIMIIDISELISIHYKQNN